MGSSDLKDLRDSIRYFLPVFCFALGVLTACFIRSKCRHTGKIHWRHLVLVMEILLLFVVGFLPPQVNWLANALTSFACAMHGAVLPHGQRQTPMPAPCVSAICEVVWIISTGL